MTLHSLIYAPLNISCVVAVMAHYTGHDPHSRIRERAFDMWAIGSAFWIPLILCNYRFVPLRHRVVVTSAANLVWTAFLSFRSTAHAHPSAVAVASK